MKHVLVTGGAGYIGSHTCKALSAAGYVPIAYDNLVYGHRDAVQWGPFEEGDILDRARLDAVFRRYCPVAVLHFAAYAYVGESVADPVKYYHNNVAGSVALLQAMVVHGIDKLVFSSTCAVYGEPRALPITEDHALAPINPYGTSKYMIETILRDVEAADGLRSIALRYFNAAGADPDGQIGESHDPETHLIPLVLDAAASRRPHVTVYGTDYDTPDGTCIRDYVHVTDLAQVHVLALAALQDGAKTTAYNLGNDRGFSVQEVIETARRVTGRAIPVEVGARRPGDPPRLVSDSAKAAVDLGWRPRFGDLGTIVDTAWRWSNRG